MSSNLREARIADFEGRACFAPDDIYQHRTHGWRYIPIHPFSDEYDVLTRLQMSPTDCRSVDAWWEIDGDATLIQTYTNGHIASLSVGLHANFTENELSHTYLTAVFATGHIDRDSFEMAMSRFAELGFPDWEVFSMNPNSNHVFLGDI